mgnify:CR=1 FL=1
MKIAVFLAPGFEEIEALTPVDYLRRAGQDVITVSVPAKGSSEKTSVVEGSHGISVFADKILCDFIDEIDENLFDAAVFPGGMPGATNLAAEPWISSFICKMAQSGKIIASLCASPAVVLAKTGVLSQKKWTCYPGMEADLAKWCGSEENARTALKNATHIPDVPFVLDGNILTGRGPGTAEQFSMKLVELCAGIETAKKVHDGSCQR